MYLISYNINFYDEMKMDQGFERKGRKKGEKRIFLINFIRIWVHTFFIQLVLFQTGKNTLMSFRFDNSLQSNN